MATVPMTYSVEMDSSDCFNHPLRKEWIEKSDHSENFEKFLYNRYNIKLIGTRWGEWYRHMAIIMEFESEQDYILWKLLQ